MRYHSKGFGGDSPSPAVWLNGHTLRVETFEHELKGTVIEGGGRIDWLKPGLMIFVR